jgi:hypothetical protein
MSSTSPALFLHRIGGGGNFEEFSKVRGFALLPGVLPIVILIELLKCSLILH